MSAYLDSSFCLGSVITMISVVNQKVGGLPQKKMDTMVGIYQNNLVPCDRSLTFGSRLQVASGREKKA